MIPKVIRLDLAYRDYSNHRECKAYEFSNVQGLTEDSIIAAFEKIGHRDIIPYQFGLPCDLAPTLHPDEQTYDGDHCYIEITQLYMTDNVKPQQHLLHCDISDREKSKKESREKNSLNQSPNNIHNQPQYVILK